MAEDARRGEAQGPNFEDWGPLTRKVLEFEQIMSRLVPSVRRPEDWVPLADFVATEDFERIGPFLDVQDWDQYTEMLTQWASTTSKFETTVRRISELPGLVYFEIEERHFRDDDVSVVNSLSVFAFDEGGKIRHLDVYLQRPG